MDDLEPVDIGKVEIDDNQIRIKLASDVYGIATAYSATSVVPEHFQHPRQGLRAENVVVDDERSPPRVRRAR